MTVPSGDQPAPRRSGAQHPGARQPGGARPTLEQFCAELTGSTAAICDVITRQGLTLPVPTCPEWTLRQLATHVGRAHRWAAEIVTTRSAGFIPFRQVPDGRLPDDPERHPEWLRAGASRLIEAIGEAGDAPVWAFGTMRPAPFWARRMTHETAVHRADAQIAAGQPPRIDPVIAADGIDEWLTEVSAPEPGEADPRAAVLDGGRTLHLHATDENLSPGGEWLITTTPAGVQVAPGHAKADVAVRGPACDLLLILVRRLAPGDGAAEVIGDGSLLAAWLAATPF